MLRAFRCLKTPNLAGIGNVRYAGYWHIDWKPAPYPCTQADREAAAKKYNLRLEDYETYPDDGLAPGDYPKLRDFHEGNRDPWEHYDYYPYKRNYNEPVPFFYDFHTEAGMDPDAPSPYGYTIKSLAMASLIAFLLYQSEQYKYFQPLKAKSFPFDGKEHYTFELDESNAH